MGGIIAKALMGAFSALFGWIFSLFALITLAILTASTQLFNWVISDNFISLSFTNPDNNPFIKMGLSFTQGLVNIIFVVAMIAIGLGTALRVRDYQVKKILPILLVTALLINFAPVLMGLVVDASNIIMNYFFSGISGMDAIKNNASVILHNFGGSMTFWNPSQAIGATVSTLAIAAFNLISAFVFFIFVFLFIMRYIVIWLLVVLSPLALAARVIPATQHYFKQWMSQFIQWTTMGVVASFFLYLADKVMFLASSPDFRDQLGKVPSGGGTMDFSGVMNQILPYGIAIAIMMIGMMAALKSSAQGAGFAMKYANKAVGKIKGFAGRQGAAFMREKMPGRNLARRLGERMMTTTTPGAGQSGFAGALKRTFSTPFTGFARATGEVINRGIGLGARKQAVSTAESEADKIQDEKLLFSRIQNELSAGGSSDKLLGYVSAGLKKGKGFQQLIHDNLKPEEAIRLAGLANQINAKPQAESIARAFADKVSDQDLEEKMGFAGDAAEARKKYGSLKAKFMAEADGDDIKGFSKGFWKSPEAMDIIQKFWGGTQIAKAAAEFKGEFIDKYNEAAAKDPKKFAESNIRAARYLSQNAAQGLGFKPLFNPTTGKAYGKKEFDAILKMKKPEFSGEEGVYMDQQVADKIFVDRVAAEAARKVYKDARKAQKENLKDLSPAATAEETKLFQDIAKGIKDIPKKMNEGSLREVRGALKEVFNAIDDMDQRIMLKTQEIKKSQDEIKKIEAGIKTPGISPAKINDLNIQLSEFMKKVADSKADLVGLDQSFKKHQTREAELKDRELKIRSALVGKTKP